MALPLILGGVALAIGAGQTIYGAAQNAKARSQQQKLINELRAEYDQEKNKAYVDTVEAQAVINTAKEQMKEQARRDEGVAAMTGQTHEAKLAARNNANKAYTNVIRQVAAGATRHRENLRNFYRGLIGGQLDLSEQQAASGSAMIGSGVNTAMAGASTLADKNTKLN